MGPQLPKKDIGGASQVCHSITHRGTRIEQEEDSKWLLYRGEKGDLLLNPIFKNLKSLSPQIGDVSTLTIHDDCRNCDEICFQAQDIVGGSLLRAQTLCRRTSH